MSKLRQAHAAQRPTRWQLARKKSRRLGPIVFGLALSIAACAASSVYGQKPATEANRAGQQVAAVPRDLEFMTKDHVFIHCRYYPGSKGKQTVPIILLHGWQGPHGAGSGTDMRALAVKLQEAGHGVAVPDLRGHGRSTRKGAAANSTQRIDRDQMRSTDFQSMILDVEAVRSFLVQENNAGRLNLELLCIIGCDMGSVVALNWIHYDWSVPSWPSLKQGQDVKAFVLVSPAQTFKGMPTRRAMSNPIVRSELSAMIIYGKDDPTRAASKRLYNTLRRSRRSVSARAKDSEKLQDLFLVEPETSLRGSKLLASRTLDVQEPILRFIQLRLVNRQESFPWRDRSRP